MSGPAKKIRFTSRVRRGLCLVRRLAEMYADDNAVPFDTFTRDWTAEMWRELRMAKEWIAQNEVSHPRLAGRSDAG